jgi:hypothetical protein
MHRLFSIMQPPLEAAHNWRQTTVCMVARNFLEVDANIFFPRVDMAGDLSGITGMEFPLLNYLIYLVSLVFGYDHWYGRLINLIVTTGGLWCFYDYLRKTFDQKTAFNTGMVLLFSLFYYYSRKIMPDTFSLALIMMGMWCWQTLVSGKNRWAFLFGFLLILAGILSKLPAALALAFLWPTFLTSNIRQKISIALGLALASIIAGWWYFIWVPHLETTFGYDHFFMGQTMSWTFQFLIDHGAETLHMFYQKALGYIGFIAFFIGLYFLARKNWNMRLIALTSFTMMILLMLKGGDKFTDHEYYIMPFIPFMSFSAGVAINRSKGWILVIILLAIGIEGVTRKWEDQFIKNGREIEHIESAISIIVNPDDLIVVNSNEYPTPLYFAQRRGWLASNDQLQKPKFVEQLREKGCSYALVLKKRFGTEVNLPYERSLETDLFILYKLTK